MGASRDLTAGYGSTALLERDRGRTTLTPPKPRFAPHVPRPSRLGSKQVVSVRGRRISTTETKRKFSRVSVLSLPLLVLGIFGAMLLSALSTQQTFTIQQLQSEERALNNEIETLNRNVEDSRAAAELAARADKAGMVVPGQAGIITVNDRGEAVEAGPADPAKTLRVVDVNSDTVRVDRATSDRRATDDVVDNLSPLPAPVVLQSLPGM
ncbi:hypothetical protein [Corynebacterium meitnerae]|uniref:Cell division protein FtsL n=1 Tax=Corynebacterium meitnerae TaxID=2913498 RepID=A0A9X3LT00_9CORY|nr:hypothetical protein [Corynebacterium meitnerae]MCZ9293236.1 hypothetical protein [Corynebacterium meitnerae]